MSEAVEKHSSVCHRLNRGLAPNMVVPEFQGLVAQWKSVAAIVGGLSGPDVKERHWKRVEDLLQASINLEEGLSVEVVFEMGMLTHVEGYEPQAHSLLVAVDTRASHPAQLSLHSRSQTVYPLQHRDGGIRGRARSSAGGAAARGCRQVVRGGVRGQAAQ